MTIPDFLKIEEIALEFATWTFDPSVLIPGTGDGEGLFVFPEEIEELFADFGCIIYAQTGEVFEEGEVDGKDAYISIGEQPVVIIESAYPEDDEDDELIALIEGGKVMFRGDTFFHQNPKGAIAKFDLT